jgi:hypothetical protein
LPPHSCALLLLPVRLLLRLLLQVPTLACLCCLVELLGQGRSSGTAAGLQLLPVEALLWEC